MPRPWSVTRSRRNEAAEACDMMASSNTEDGIGPACDIKKCISAKPPVYALACAALDAVYTRPNEPITGNGYDTVREAWAEAAQLLRDGWTPGDTVIPMSEKLEREYQKAIEAKHDAMNASNVPSDIETVQTETEEVRQIDDGPVDVLPELTAMNEQVAAALDGSPIDNGPCEDPNCPALEHPEDLHTHDIEPDDEAIRY